MLTKLIISNDGNKKTTWFRVFTKVILITGLYLAVLPCIVAQQPFQDAKGESTLFIDGGGFAQINVADPSIRLGYLYDTGNDWTFGANLNGKLSGTRANFINNNRVAPDAQISFSIGKRYIGLEKFDAEKVTVTTVFLAGVERVLRRERIIASDTQIPSPRELRSLFPRVKLTKQIDDFPNLRDYLERLVDFCGAAEDALKNEDIVRFVKAAKPAQEIKEKIRVSPTNFKTTPEAISLLKDEKVPDDVILAMQAETPIDVSKFDFCKIKGADIGEIFELPELKKYTSFNRLVFQGGYGFRQYNLFDPTASFDKQLYKKDFHTPSARLIYFHQVGGNKLLGASVGLERSNNSNSLTEIDVRDFISSTNSNTIREFGRTRKALRGDFKQSTRAFINTDFAYFPGALKSRIGINFFTRSGLTGDEKGFQPGVGVFFSEKGSPTRVIGGASFSLVDGKPNVSLIAGYNF